MSMSQEPQAGGSSDLDLETVLALIGIASAAVAFGIINPRGMAHTAAKWLVDHGVLTAVDDALIPLVLGTGLGWRQLGILLCALVGAVAVLRLRRRRGQDRAPKGKGES